MHEIYRDGEYYITADYDKGRFEVCGKATGGLSRMVNPIPKTYEQHLRAKGTVPRTTPLSVAHFTQSGGWRSARSLRRVLPAIEQSNADAAARLEAAVPGITAILAAREDEERWHEEFEAMMDDESNDGANPPKPVRMSSEELLANNPRAAAYLRAKRDASLGADTDYLWKASKAGERAIERLLAGRTARIRDGRP